jgi:ElaB/YqjD/DUF883 family membrane-anchored ribosome-binding protein
VALPCHFSEQARLNKLAWAGFYPWTNKVLHLLTKLTVFWNNKSNSDPYHVFILNLHITFWSYTMNEVISKKFEAARDQLIARGNALKTEGENLRGQATAKFDEVRGQATAKFDEVRGQATVKFDEVRGQATVKFDEVRGQATAKFDEVRGQATSKFEETRKLVEAKIDSLRKHTEVTEAPVAEETQEDVAA